MKSFFNIFNKGFRKTAVSFSRKLGEYFKNLKKWDEETFETLEAALIGADLGVNASLQIVDSIRERYKQGKLKASDDIIKVTKNEILSILGEQDKFEFNASSKLNVIMLVGVNGCGKTTTAGKLAYRLKQDSHKVMLAACDTFRAAAVEQLQLWGKKTNTHVVTAKYGADPAAVAFDAVKASIAKDYDVLILDTAGRQHNKKGLMEELSKIKKSIFKAENSVKLQSWLVLDSSVGGNALSQAKEFTNLLNINGVIPTKLDGTSKGGTLIALKKEFKLPIYFVGLGEAAEHLQPFDPNMFTEAIFEEL